MASADDILFEPIERVPPWRKRAREVSEYIVRVGQQHKPMISTYPMDRPRPSGSLTLEELMELCHEHGQRRFFLVISMRHSKLLESFPCDGTIELLLYEHGHAPRLGSYYQHSIRDLNLVPNTYTRHYVFQNENDARSYMNSL